LELRDLTELLPAIAHLKGLRKLGLEVKEEISHETFEKHFLCCPSNLTSLPSHLQSLSPTPSSIPHAYVTACIPEDNIQGFNRTNIYEIEEDSDWKRTCIDGAPTKDPLSTYFEWVTPRTM